MAWSRPIIRAVIRDDLYKPHTVDELRELEVSETVLDTLEAGKVYCIYRYENIPVPVPDAGIPREAIEAARYRVLSNRTTRGSRADSRVWGLSGGVLRCADCGRAMQCLTVSRKNHTYHYYRCQSNASGSADPCAMRKNLRADEIEAEVWEGVRRLLDDKEYTLGKMRESFDTKRRELSGPGLDAGVLERRLNGIEISWVKYQKAYEADAISVADLAARRTEFKGQREQIERELERLSNREAELEHLEAEQAQIEDRIREGWVGLDDASPEKRREVYEDLRLSVEVGEDRRAFLTAGSPLGEGSRLTRRDRSRAASSTRRDRRATVLVVLKRRLRGSPV